MKVHLNQEPRCALVWNFGPDRPGFGILELAARQYKLRLRAVGEAELGATVGNLVAGRPGKPMPEAVSLPDRAALIVSGLRTDDGSRLVSACAALPGVERCRLEKSKTVWVRGNWVREWEKGKNYR